MKTIFFVTACLVASGTLSPTRGLAVDCQPACGSGQTCCIMQHSSGTYSHPRCQTGNAGSCVVPHNSKTLKAFDASTVTADQVAAARAVAKAKKKAAATNAAPTQ
jgi:hypothetical protein